MSAISPEQLEELLARHGPALAFYARQWTAAPDDIVQEAFVELFRRDTAPDRVEAWLYGTVRRLALFAARTSSRRRRREREVASMRRAWVESNGHGAADTDRLMRGVDSLDATEREIVVARIWSGLTFEEIGQLVGLSSSTAHRRYCQALESLKSLMNGRLS